MQKKLNPVIITTLHVGVYMIELFSKAAIISVHVILLQILAVLWWSLEGRYARMGKFEHCIASTQQTN